MLELVDRADVVFHLAAAVGVRMDSIVEFVALLRDVIRPPALALEVQQGILRQDAAGGAALRR
jgi:hypothetical protein